MKKTSRRRSNSRSTSKCRPGPITRNPYLNFLREYRMKNKCQPAIEQTRQAAKEWKKLNREDKTKYIVEAFYARKILPRQSRVKVGLRRQSAARRSRQRARILRKMR